MPLPRKPSPKLSDLLNDRPEPYHDIPCERIRYATAKQLFDEMLLEAQGG